MAKTSAQGEASRHSASTAAEEETSVVIGVASAAQGFRSMCTYSVVEIVHLWQILVYHGTPGSDNVAKVEILTVPCLVFSLLFRFTIIICQ